MKKSILALTAFIAIAPAAAMAQQPVRVGGNVSAPMRVKYVPPTYPIEAQRDRVSGLVVVEAIINTEGDVSDARVLKSVAELDEAAILAVKQWKYTPTTLNGVPVPVIMTVTVNFSLSGPGVRTTPQEVLNASTVPTGQLPSQMPAEWNGKSVIKIGGTIKAPERVKYVAPAYPEIAQAAQVTGVVIIEALIDEEGNVATAKVVRSIPLLDQAALDAVMQWKYAPTLLNGAPVPVVMTVTVNYTLSSR